jgi:hypothetical protein
VEPPAPSSASSFVSALVRPITSIGLVATVCYLAIIGIAEARQALLAAFPMLLAFYWGERSALKQPEKKN